MNYRRWFPFLTCGMLMVAAWAETPIKDLVARLDPATGKFPDVETEFTISGIVSARLTLPDGQILAYVQASGETGVPVLAVAADTAALVPRQLVTLKGTFTNGPLGTSALRITAGSCTVGGTNRPFGSSEVRGADFFKDPSSLNGRYVQITNVSFTATKFGAQGVAKVRAENGSEVNLLVSKAVAGLETPKGSINVFGVPVRNAGAWYLLAARFLPTNGKMTQNLATKHTCLTCHTPDAKILGPSYRDVAARYRSDPEAAGKLVLQMEAGGSGKWGPVAMTPFRGKVPPDEMKQLADWILSYRWDALLSE